MTSSHYMHALRALCECCPDLVHNYCLINFFDFDHTHFSSLRHLYDACMLYACSMHKWAYSVLRVLGMDALCTFIKHQKNHIWGLRAEIKCAYSIHGQVLGVNGASMRREWILPPHSSHTKDLVNMGSDRSKMYMLCAWSAWSARSKGSLHGV